MTLSAPAVRPAVSAKPGPLQFLLDTIRQTLAIAEVDVRKLKHDPSELLTRAIQPTLWLLVFGTVMGRMRGVNTGTTSYRDFMAPGILAQSVLFIAIFYGIAVIWERDLGILQKFMVSPAPRVALVLGKSLSAGVRGLTQAVFIYLLCLVVGIQVRLSIWAFLGVVLCTFLGAAIFATFSLVIACIVRNRERLMGIGQLLTMPLFFASNAIYPIDLMPTWLQWIAHINPLTYQVDALRAMMLRSGTSVFGLGLDFAIQVLILAGLVALAAKLYPKIVA